MTSPSSHPSPPPTLLVRPESIPIALTERDQWVCWAWTRTDNLDKPWTKVPINPHTGARASSRNPRTWVSFTAALQHANAHDLAGVGWVFSADDPFAGVDFDGIRDPVTGVVDQEASEIITSLNSYTEISPSGRGVHVIVAGTLPPGGRKRGSIEMYDQGRFFTVTGHLLPSAPDTVWARQGVLEALHARTFGTRPGTVLSVPHLPVSSHPRPHSSSDSPPRTDLEVVAQASSATKGEKVQRLLAGDWDGYSSQSEADLALCSLFAFQTSDPVQIDRLYRGSNLMRPKWDDRHFGDGRSYGEATISRALERRGLWRRGSVGSSRPTGKGPDPPGESPSSDQRLVWNEPVPLTASPRPAFPTELLPARLRGFVDAVALATQTPAALAALLCLAVLAAAAAKRVAICLRDGWIEPVNIYVVGALRPGERKSAVFAEVVAPLEAWEATEAARLGPDVEAAATQAKIAEHTLEKLRRAAAGEDDPTKKDALVRKATSLAQEIATGILPEIPRALVDDCSPERLASLMSRHGGRIAAMSAEGGLFDIMAGRYGKDASPNLDVFLKGHAGDAIRVDRVGRAPDYVRSPALTLALTVQPEVIQGLAGKPGFRGRGLLARIWFALPESLVGHRRIKPPSVPEDTRRAYADLITHVLNLQSMTAADGSPTPRLLTLSPEAADAHLAFEAELEPQLGEFGALAHVADWGGKLAGASARLAALLHLAEHPEHGRPWEVPVAGPTMTAAVAIAEHFLAPHALAAFAEMGTDPVIEDARLVLRWLERRSITEVSRRDLLAHLSKRLRQGASLDVALRLLIEEGYLQPLIDTSTGGPGRPPSPHYAVNPLWRPHNPHNPQNDRVEGGFADSEDSVDGDPSRGSEPSGMTTTAGEDTWDVWEELL